MNPTGISSTPCFDGREENVTWKGYAVNSDKEFCQFLASEVRARTEDLEDGFEESLRGIASTGMDQTFLETFLNTASAPPPPGWEVGEALAECLLEEDQDREVIWPWNQKRDKRTPKASLPGADLVGFCKEGEDVQFLFGEVKSSTEMKSPPGVMGGADGMIAQLTRLATQRVLQRELMQWLQARCKDGVSRQLWEQACEGFMNSDGKLFLLVGILMRDTDPNEKDLRPGAKKLAAGISGLTAELIAWYAPIPMADWPGFLREDVV